MPDPIDLDHIERLLAEATPGPWERGRFVLFDAASEEIAHVWDDADAALIAALVTAAPAMVAEIRRLRAEVADAWVAVGSDVEDTTLGEEIRYCARMLAAEVATAREEGRAEERAAVLRYLAAADGDLEEAAGDIEEGYHHIERGKHREEDDNA